MVTVQHQSHLFMLGHKYFELNVKVSHLGFDIPTVSPLAPSLSRAFVIFLGHCDLQPVGPSAGHLGVFPCLVLHWNQYDVSV